jgi:hypothetical protein
MDAHFYRTSHGHQKTAAGIFLSDLKLQNKNKGWVKNTENFQSPSYRSFKKKSQPKF